ncbi:hypothetical protein HGRIS_014385 [Hohenbuehelia grisea]|uniref:NodB homology domain-containing protein n=1 Tax=Hohenbuehelia grisea TaxID=104357 RepID=A0ABR3JVH7_9AGAR
MFASFFVTAALALLAAAAPQKRQLAQVITQCTKPNMAALTFDDGPWVYLYDVSKALKAAGAVGTFFLNGNNYECIYSEANVKRVKYAYDKGHQIASHTWGHKNLATLTWDQVHDEMWRVEREVPHQHPLPETYSLLITYQRLSSASSVFNQHSCAHVSRELQQCSPFSKLRPAFGSYNDNVRAAAANRGQKIVNWDLDSGDSVGVSVQESKNRYKEVAQRRPITVLALNHETQQKSVHEVLPYAIAELQKAGYKLVTVAECLGMQPYQWVGTPQARTSDWKC